MEEFKKLGLITPLLKAVNDLGFEMPTPIQKEAIPLILEGHNLVGQAPTGTGKTAAYLLPVLQRIQRGKKAQVLIVTPTRELALQVADEVAKLGKYLKVRALAVYGGQAIERQIRGLRQGVEVIVGTPGRILDHIGRKTFPAAEIKIVILDEADEMLDMGFIDDIEAILNTLTNRQQTLLFSATLPAPIKTIIKKFLGGYKTVKLVGREKTVPAIRQVYYELPETEKIEGLVSILNSELPIQAIVFCRTKKRVDEVVEQLNFRGYAAKGLHGDMSQRERTQTIKSFKAGKTELLVATDVAARGLDIPDVSHVINFDIPQNPESYIHRIGRTGRAGREGKAITLINYRERKLLKAIEEAINKRLKREILPEPVDLEEARFKKIAKKILDTITKGVPALYLEMAARLLEEEESEQLLGATLYLLEDRSLQNDF
ncbi:DEAD/DEAH box helicase [Carboxydothermus hydrogenoformans]|uniref:RNA helicase n=1 Tax=Carboxydothermus hydrogenoformans (strain ATCC BAA-161 / DSM 6008 / Z-2901) TaxID=246194 RepID=Q3AFI3_CARHZ|nr:DEAD/DEAH box helicase [Carboxydothermus hydrogenoformans]ABB13920.1 ATP-dependent RNA helicase, DEAD box family [Carboxydothermus hydrogenoformans Z-2901]